VPSLVSVNRNVDDVKDKASKYTKLHESGPSSLLVARSLCSSWLLVKLRRALVVTSWYRECTCQQAVAPFRSASTTHRK
jgi:hypothetical protein